MSSKIDGVPRELLEVIANSSERTFTEINAAIQQAREILAAPVVERQPVAYEKPNSANYYGHSSAYIDWKYSKDTMALVEHLESVIDAVPDGPLYTAPPELAELQESLRLEQDACESWKDTAFKLHEKEAELQATIAQLETKLNNAINLDFDRREELAKLTAAPANAALIKDLTEIIDRQSAEIERLKGEAVAQKYDDTLLPFVALMRKELHSNDSKGDRPGWLSMSADTCLLEIIYHFGKLQASVKRGDGDGMSEYGADVANMCMMLLDICGVLSLVDIKTQPVSSASALLKEASDWIKMNSFGGTDAIDLWERLDLATVETTQPTPASVAPNESAEFEKWWTSIGVLKKNKLQIAQEAWQASAQINTTRPSHANAPADSGTHPHNDGLDDYRGSKK